MIVIRFRVDPFPHLTTVPDRIQQMLMSHFESLGFFQREPNIVKARDKVYDFKIEPVVVFPGFHFLKQKIVLRRRVFKKLMRDDIPKQGLVISQKNFAHGP